MTTNQTAPVTDEVLDQMIWKLERDGMTPKQLSLMRELREVRRAKGEPVAYADQQSFINFKSEGGKNAACTKEWMWRDSAVGLIPLYTAPPAPVVPDIDSMRLIFESIERDSDDGFNLHKYGIGYADEKTQSRWNAWLSCRAAMLSPGNSEQLEPVSNRDELKKGLAAIRNSGIAIDGEKILAERDALNSPATPDDWIPVSERMPGREYVIAADISGAYYPPHLPNTQVGIYADWFEDGNPSWDDGDGNDLHLKQVTHWMPLPAAPKEVG